jgi:glycosyltransferase involved in cell wall biosynthesis
MARPKVSVIIPTFNRRELVSKAVESVLAQTLAVEEIIVVDDGSSDGTAEALEEKYGQRVTVIRQANAGVSTARNRGLAQARGEFLAFLDSDDTWMPTKTEKQVRLLESDPRLGMVVCDIVRKDERGEVLFVTRRRDAIPEDGHALKWVLRLPSLGPPSVMLRREVYEQVGGFDPSLRTAEDVDFFLRVARRWPVGVVDESLTEAVARGDGLSELAQTYDDYLLVHDRFVAQCRGEVPARDLDMATAHVSLRIARGLVMQGRWREAAGLCRRALRAAPAPGTAADILRIGALAARRWASGRRRVAA